MLSGMTFGQAMEHTLTQLTLMERAAHRVRCAASSAACESTLAAVAPFWSKDGGDILRKFSKRMADGSKS